MMKEYVNQIMRYDLQSFINYLSKHPLVDEVISRDITQLSNIDDCTINMCKMMLQYGNKGFTLTEIASNLHDTDSYKDNQVALVKYGENQVKTASQMGLAVFKNELWFLSGIGFVFGELEEENQKKYLAINLLRDPFYSKVILSLCKSDTKLRDYMSILSETTQTRRASSCMKVISFFLNQCKFEGVHLYNLISK